jgi:cysteine desulfurase family protein
MYFNHNASSYPKPNSVRQAIDNILQQYPENEARGNHSDSQTIEQCRSLLKSFFQADNQEYEAIFCGSNTEALNLCLFGLPQTNADKPTHIISTVTEHNAVLRPLWQLESQGKAKIDLAPCDSDGFVKIDDIAALIRKNTAAIVISHASNVTGAIQNIAEISALAQKNNIRLIVDAAQSAGAIPISLAQTPVDALCFCGHKSLWGIAGTGGLMLNRQLTLQPLKVGGTGSQSNLKTQPTRLPQRYEAGTANTVGIAALAAGIQYVQNISFNIIAQKKEEIYNFLWQKLQSHKNIQLFAVKQPTPNKSKIPVLNVAIQGWSNDDLSYLLQKSFSIHCRSGLHCAPLIHNFIGADPLQGTLRLSFSHLNTLDEAEILANALLQAADIC